MTHFARTPGWAVILLAALVLSGLPASLWAQGLRPAADDASGNAESLGEARFGFRTHLLTEIRDNEPIPAPPPELFTVVSYPAPLGNQAAYLSVASPGADPAAGRPAIVWITGGTPAARGGSYVWQPGPHRNDQSASPFRDAGIQMMFPTVRGTCANPGFHEGLLGEVDDVIAAGEFLRALPGVDPDRVYLGGHSTGGTLALLVAETTDIFSAVFAFGPVGDLADYGGITWPFDTNDPQEFYVRSPLYFLDGITSPTYVIEGTGGNIEDIVKLTAVCQNPAVRLLVLENADHFSPLTPVNRLLASKIMSRGDEPFSVDLPRITAAYSDFWPAQREARDLHRIATLRARGLAWGEPLSLRFVLGGGDRERLVQVGRALVGEGLTPAGAVEGRDQDEDPYFRLALTRELPFESQAVLDLSRVVGEAATSARLDDEGWAAMPAKRR